MKNALIPLYTYVQPLTLSLHAGFWVEIKDKTGKEHEK